MESARSELVSGRMQRVNPYNAHLPYANCIEHDASAYLEEIKSNLKRNIAEGNLRFGAVKTVVDLHKYIILYGLRFSKEDHVFFLKVTYELIVLKHLDSVSLEKIGKVFISLIKKRYLLKREDLVLDWRPLFDAYYHWEDSSAAVRAMVKAQDGFKSQLKMVIKFARAFFPDSATAEMLAEWRPMLCPFDRSIITAAKYMTLFLPTNCDLSPERSYKLWFDELMNLWRAFANSPTWEVEVFQIFSRLAFHNVGRIDWSPHYEKIFTHIMNSFALPVTYAKSGIMINYGLGSSSASFTIAARWIVSAINGGDGAVLDYLERMLSAIESYYHPANSNSASDGLHSFISVLCALFVQRVHIERYNTKWAPKAPKKTHLRDEDITRFVQIIKPIAFQILFSNYDEEKRSIFNTLSTLRPDLIIPDLLEKLNAAYETLTEPHRFTACVAALSSSCRPFVENYPLEVIDTLHLLLPGMNVNDVWKCSDNFILLSDILEMVWLIDFSSPASRCKDEPKPTSAESRVLAKTSVFEDFVLQFTDLCLTLIESSSREQTRAEVDLMDEALNEEEITVDAAVTDTFQKMVWRCSPKIFERSFEKLKSYVSTHILEAAVSGSTLASMCKSMAVVSPEMVLSFFLPHLCQRIEVALHDRADEKKADRELQFALLLLSEVVSTRGVPLHASRGQVLLPYLDRLCSVLDQTLDLEQRDESELAATVLLNVIYTLVHVRPLQKVAAKVVAPLVWRRDAFTWARHADLDRLDLDWYIPSGQELAAAQALFDKYLGKAIQNLQRVLSEEIEMEKEEVLRNLRRIYKILQSCSEVLEPARVQPAESSMASNLQPLDGIRLTLCGQPVRETVIKFIHNVLLHLMEVCPDDSDSLNTIVSIYDVLLLQFGMDETDLSDHIEDYKAIKIHRLNKMVRSKKHMESVLVDRVTLQHETHVWLKNLLQMSSLPPVALKDVFDLSVSHYSDVRACAQELLNRMLEKTMPRSHEHIVPNLIECLKDSPDVSHQMFKGALYIITGERFGFFYEWETASKLMPALVMAQHSDKPSVVELLKDVSYRSNRSTTEFALYTLPVMKPKPSAKLLKLLGLAQDEESEDVIDPHFLQLQSQLCEMVRSKKLHWRHEQMAYGMMLLLLVHNYCPPEEVVEMWLQTLINHDRSMRLVAFQALEGILKVCQLSRKRAFLEYPKLGESPDSKNFRPGCRPDNEWLQYRSMSDQELTEYWERPFAVKPYLGFSPEWPQPKVKLRVVDEAQHDAGSYVRRLFVRYFADPAYLEKFVEFNTLEHKKGEDSFSTDKALFLSFLFENFGEDLLPHFLPYMERLASSATESDQRVAAEMFYGVVKGARFWSLPKTKALWSSILPVLETALNRMTAETVGDWEAAINSATNKHDANRLFWLFDALLKKDQLLSCEGAFKESSLLRILTKAIMQNWKARELYLRTYESLRVHWDHPYDKVRLQISKVLAILLSMDIPYGGHDWNMGAGFPAIASFIEDITPMLCLNVHNPELNGMLKAGDDEPMAPVSNGTSTPMDTDEGSQDSRLQHPEHDSSPLRALQTTALFVSNFINMSSVAIGEEIYRLMPFLCQYTGSESEKDVSQYCLSALCYLSMCIVPSRVLPTVFSMCSKLASSPSWKAKLSMLEFFQVFLFTNFISTSTNANYVREAEDIICRLLKDLNMQVRQKASNVLCGLVHSNFLPLEDKERLIQSFRSKIRRRMLRINSTERDNKNRARFRKEATVASNLDEKLRLAEFHSGVLGLCAFVEAFPYDVPKFVPDILMELEKHLHDPQPIPKTIKTSLQEFKRTHQDNWDEHRLKFTEDQLVTLTDLLVSPNYYA